MQQALLLLAAAAAAASRMWPQPHAADAPVAVGDETPRGASAVPTLLPPAGPTGVCSAGMRSLRTAPLSSLLLSSLLASLSHAHNPPMLPN